MSEEKKAATIVVTRDTGTVQRYAAPNFGMLHDGTLVIGDKVEGDDVRVDAMIAPGRWITATKDGAEVADAQAEALGITRRALGEAWRELVTAQAQDSPVGKIVDGAIADLFNRGYE